MYVDSKLSNKISKEILGKELELAVKDFKKKNGEGK